MKATNRFFFPSDCDDFELITKIYLDSGSQGRTQVSVRKLLEHFHYPNIQHMELLENSDIHTLATKFTKSAISNISNPENREYLISVIDSSAQKMHVNCECANAYTFFRIVLCKYFYYSLFCEEASPATLSVYVNAVKNFHETLKGKHLRSKHIRDRALTDIHSRIWGNGQFFDSGELARWQGHELALSQQILGTFFFTAIVQISEVLAHSLIEISRTRLRPDTITGKAAITDFCRAVVFETLRLFPPVLNNARHTLKTISKEGIIIPKNSDLFLNFVELQRLGWSSPALFQPDRWLKTGNFSAEPDGIHCPFGVGQRTCPAKGYSLSTINLLLVRLVQNFLVVTDDRTPNSRRLPNGVHFALIDKCEDKVTFSKFPTKIDIDSRDRNIWGGIIVSLKSTLFISRENNRFQLHQLFPVLTLLRSQLLSDRYRRG